MLQSIGWKAETLVVLIIGHNELKYHRSMNGKAANLHCWFSEVEEETTHILYDY